MNKLLTSLVLFMGSICNIVFRAYVESILWSWFIVSQFPIAPRIGTVGMLGIGATVNLIISKHTTINDVKKYFKDIAEDKKDETITDELKIYQTVIATAADIFFTLWAWLCGYIIFHFFMKV